MDAKAHWIDREDVEPFFRSRPKDTHKGSYGHLLLIGGSVSKPGAILLSGRSALRTGAGLVTVALPDKAFRKFPKKFLELMYDPLPSTPRGTLSRKGWGKILKNLEGKKAVAAGPGMGVDGDTRPIIRHLVTKTTIPLILDADALNALTVEGISLLKKKKGEIILTPHPGEMARLTGKTTVQVQRDRLKLAKDFAVEHGVFLILKGFRTLVATPRGEVFINSTGNPGMATAGMGDVLTGIVGSLVVQGLTPEQAAVAGVYLHGRAGDRVAERLGDRGLLATDVIEEIPLAIKELIRGEGRDLS